MHFRFAVMFSCILSMLACRDHVSESTANNNKSNDVAEQAAFTISYQNDIRPIFEKKCVACHACYDAPCQLNLASATGLQRGANKNPVYNSTRLQAMQPTRLFIDALDEQSWRRKGFFSVLNNEGDKSSLMLGLLELGRSNNFNDNAVLAEHFQLESARDSQCPTRDEFAEFAKNHAHSGMPYAATGLSDDEYATVSAWLQAGAELESQQILLNPEEYRQINDWESLFNGSSNKQRLAARYLYEHLFIAHLYFSDISSHNFFRLIRSSTPPGKAIKPIATTRPNDETGGDFWYRLMPLEGAIVYKTHITYALNEKRKARFKTLFFDADWKVATLPGYSHAERGNPFTTFASIPARSRYQFMLDDAAFFVRTFIRGPVCHGQIATDVIRDRFWNIFQAPETDLYVTDSAYRKDVSDLLAVPGIDDDLEDILPQWVDYRSRNERYLQKRQAAYQTHYPEGPELNAIWDGDGSKPDALLTIFRHHNNAAVQTGLIGAPPKTIWVMDFALLERSYYVLVGNFNVFGNIAHQTLTRLYFDLIRNGAEQNFLRFMPRESRRQLIKDWYQGAAQVKVLMTYDAVDTSIPTAIAYSGGSPVAEFSGQVRKALAAVQVEPGVRWEQADRILMPLTQHNGASMPFIKLLPEVSFLRIYDEYGKRVVYSMLRDRAHSNVAFMLGEDLRYQPDADQLTIYPGILGSYPNFIFNIPADELDHFSSVLQQTKTQAQFRDLVKTWGVRRSHTEFWSLLHDFTAYLRETNPFEAGIFDISRYQNL